MTEVRRAFLASNANWEQASSDLQMAASAYSDQFFGRVLSQVDVMRGLEEILVVQDACGRLHDEWRHKLAELPSRDELDSVAEGALRVSSTGTLGWIWATLKKATPRTGAVTVMRGFESISNDGYETLRQITPMIPFAIHLEGEASRAAVGDGDNSTEAAAGLPTAASNARQTLESIVESIDRDIESQRSQVQLLSSYTQTGMTEEVRGLTRALTLLTILVVLLTVGALIISAVHA